MYIHSHYNLHVYHVVVWFFKAWLCGKVVNGSGVMFLKHCTYCLAPTVDLVKCLTCVYSL